jgi:lysophospholipase-2
MASAACQRAFLFMHGLGDQGSSWRSLASDVKGVTKWSFPNAPNAPVSVNGGARMPSWFDMDEIPVVATSTDAVADVKASVARCVWGFFPVRFPPSSLLLQVPTMRQGVLPHSEAPLRIMRIPRG